MRAYELQPRDGFDALTAVDRPPQPLGPTDVRVRVRAVSLNFRDLGVVKGAKKRKAPVIPASDGAGEVIEIGSAVTRHAVGDRVAAAFFPYWQSGEPSELNHAHALGGSQDGMLAEQVVLPETSWLRMPARLSFEAAATLPCAGVTAYNALFETARLRAGDVVLVQGTGGVSIFGLQLAKAAGARVIVTSSSAAKRERAVALGADHVIDYKAVPTWGDSAREWTGGRGVDIVIEVGGPGTFDQSVAALRYGGAMSIPGVLTGVRGEVNTYGIFHKSLRIGGVYVGSIAMFEGLVRALEAARIEPVIDRVFGFGEVKDAYAHLASGAHFGKVVVRID
jgi:NADPH:quinone reductase-like Zn-dependent oxidoreductase